jgi:hypothetical protein
VLGLTYRGGVLPLRFVPYHRLADTANAVVDGSPTSSTVLTLSHWPGSPTPIELQDDLSAQIAFRALAEPSRFDGIEAVSNNHFDQDGLVSAFALIDPEAALARRDLLIDVASAGDFAVFTDRDAMRVAMALAAHDDPERSPFGAALFADGYEEQCGRLYEALLPRLVGMVDHPESVRHLWEHEDAHLTESLAAIDAGVVRLHEEPELDLAVCVVPDEWAARATTRFTMTASEALHPAALPNRTSRMRVVVSQAGAHRLQCRYETWVMFRSRPLAPRPDLRLLAARLDEVEGRAVWHAGAPGSLTPELVPASATALSLDQFLAETCEFLRTALPAWDPAHRT